MKITTYLILFSAFSFIFFGWACFFSPSMKSEFKRYGLVSYRKLVGGLQLLGSVGLLIGFFYFPVAQIVSAAGLSILMLLGFFVRLKIKDSFIQTMPSLFYALLNAYLLYLL